MGSQFEGLTRDELIRELKRRETYLQQSGLQILVQELETQREVLACQNEQMRGAESLIEAERNRYSELFDSAPLPLLALDVNGSVIEANSTACAFFAIEQWRIVGTPFSTLLHQESQGDFRTHLLHARYSEAGVVRTELKLREHLNGSRVVELHTQAVIVENHTRFRTAVFCLDGRQQTTASLSASVAELEQRVAQQAMQLQNAGEALRIQTERSAVLEARLQASEAKFRGLTQAETVGIALWHADGRITDANQTLLDLLGYHREQLQHLPLGWMALTPPEYAEADRQLLDQLRSVGRCKPYEKELLRRDGSRVPVVIGAALMPGSTDEGIAIVLDLTERKAAERLLQKSEQRERQRSHELKILSESLDEMNRRKDQFLAMLGHELRNPLGPLANASDLLRRYCPQLQESDELWDIVQRQIAHLSRLVDDLLDVSRISAGRILLRRSTVDLAEIVRRTAADLGSVVADSGLSIHVGTPHTPVWVDGDPTRLAQVVGNLISNACKFTDAGGSIELTLTADSGFARLQVCDTGIGIRSDLLDRLFTAFVQVDDSIARSRGGLGLGLALVRGLVELHGGQVRAESDGIGSGTTFHISLPLVIEGADSGETVHCHTSDSLRVLVVEDNRDAGFMLRKLLQSLGHEVVVATDGKIGLNLAIDFRPDLVLADIGLPGMDGYVMAEALRALPEFAATYFVAISGYGKASDQEKALLAGYDQHITKPASTDTLEWVLRLAATRRAGNSAAIGEGDAAG